MDCYGIICLNYRFIFSLVLKARKSKLIRVALGDMLSERKSGPWQWPIELFDLECPPLLM